LRPAPEHHRHACHYLHVAKSAGKRMAARKSRRSIRRVCKRNPPSQHGTLEAFVSRFLRYCSIGRPLARPIPAVSKFRSREMGHNAMKYADAGVNIAVADEAKQRIRHLATRTFTNGVLGGIGSFGALFALDPKKFKEPILVSSADGVGTKLKVAMAMDVHSTVGGDLVNHCVNDILVQGAEPLFFLDYLALGQMNPHIVEQLVDGMSRACRKAGCALIGGETAEMPGFYQPGEYDLAGFIVGAVERKNLLTGKNVKA